MKSQSKATHQAMLKASNSRRNLHEQEAQADERSNTKIRIALYLDRSSSSIDLKKETT